MASRHRHAASPRPFPRHRRAVGCGRKSCRVRHCRAEAVAPLGVNPPTLCRGALKFQVVSSAMLATAIISASSASIRYKEAWLPVHSHERWCGWIASDPHVRLRWRALSFPVSMPDGVATLCTGYCEQRNQKTSSYAFGDNFVDKWHGFPQHGDRWITQGTIHGSGYTSATTICRRSERKVHVPHISVNRRCSIVSRQAPREAP